MGRTLHATSYTRKTRAGKCVHRPVATRPKMAASASGRSLVDGAAAEAAEQNARGTAGMPTVLITGANRGLGLEFARQYATSGWRVIATSRAPEKADALHALGQRVSVHRLDVADLAAGAAVGRAPPAGTVHRLLANAPIPPPPAHNPPTGPP